MNDTALAADQREAAIVRTSVVGIAANVALAAMKAAIGLASNSIAIVLDAVNNLSDALSSIITIAGTKLARKQPDKKHPLGYGRIEYLTATIIAMIVLYAGITSLIESVEKIVSPEVADYSAITLILVGAAVVVKLILGRYVKKQGEKHNSDALVASGSDALFDAILSASTLAAALVYILCHISIEAWVGAIISVVIVKAGIDMMRDALSEILGERIDADLAHTVKESVRKDPEVLGAYDLLLHSYGPEHLVGDIHVEVPGNMNAGKIDEMTRRIQQQVFRDTDGKVILATVGIYSKSLNHKAACIQKKAYGIALAEDHVKQVHGFHLDEERQLMTFDIVVDFDAPDREAVRADVLKKIRAEYPAYDIVITLDSDTSD
ncbi:cation diffusion facilitator family transporter [Olsenella sp. AGMB03486]|uniref:cation diffusion facilitator family transporter n=1 Tax=Olsenella sp. AGMB03486 TaxID=3230364 RepID=UPI0034A04AE6